MPGAQRHHDLKPNQRRSTRVVQTIRVKISWPSAPGVVLEREAETLVVSQCGARIHTDLPLLLGSAITITIPSTGAQADAVVTWVSLESRYEFGIELTNASDIWGVGFRDASASPRRD